MTTIYKNYQDFLAREDKKHNGVSKEFSANNPNWGKENKTNEGCWNCSDCSGCSRCSGCSDCSDCYGCSGCSRCYGCSRLSLQTDIKNTKTKKNAASGFPNVPIIENIHQKLYNTIKPNGHSNKLEMSDWHTCDTTHCRAGWITFLAGKEGKELEEKTSTQFAAMQIYKASSPIKVSPPRFFESNEVAMADIKRCAEEEAAL